MKKKRLNKDSYSIHDYNFFGISAGIRDYRLSWILNQCLSTKFRRIDDFCIEDKKNQAAHCYSKFYFEDSVNRVEYFLVKASADGRLLNKRIVGIDYLLIIQSQDISLDFLKEQTINEKDIRLIHTLDFKLFETNFEQLISYDSKKKQI